MGDDNTETDGGTTTNQITDIGSGGGGGPSVNTPSGGISEDPYNQDNEQSRRGFLKAAAAALGIGGAAVGGAEVATEESLFSLGSGSSRTEESKGGTADKNQDRDLTVPSGFQTYRENLEEAGNLEKASEGVRGDPQLTGNDIQNMLEEAETVQDELQFLVQNTETHYLNEAMKEYSAQKQDTDSYVIGNTTFGSFPGANEDISEFIVVENGEIQGVQGINAFWGTQQGEYTRQNGGHDALQNLYNPEKAGSVIPEDLQGLQKIVRNFRRDIGSGPVPEEDIKEFKQMIYEAASATIPGVSKKDANLRFADIESGMTLYEAKYGDGNGEIIKELSKAYNEIEKPESFDTITADYNAGWELTPENGVNPVDPLTQ